jgi:hypothetical protein
MTKNVRPPATAEQMLRSIGATQEDLEIVDRLLREIGEYDDPPVPCDRPAERRRSAREDE